MNLTLICPSFQTCLECITHGCEWVLHWENPDACMMSHLLSPFTIDYAILPGSVCPPVEVVAQAASGLPVWSLVLMGGLLLLLGFFGNWGFRRMMAWYNNRQGRIIVAQIPDPEAPQEGVRFDVGGDDGHDQVHLELPRPRQQVLRRSRRIRQRDNQLSPMTLRSGRKLK